MGYRLRLGKIAKKERNKYKGKTEQEVYSMMVGDEAPYRLSAHTELYELGKYVEHSEGMEEFYDVELEENDFKIISKDGLKSIIRYYHEQTFQYYKELKGGVGLDSFFRSKLRTWGHVDQGYSPYYLDEERTDGEIVSSWNYEYAIFNLVYIYRSFDWDNNYLIYSGW